MRAGRLRSTVSLERQSETQDAMGQRVRVWAALATARASIEPIRGKELIAASGERAELTTRIRIRYSTTVSFLQPRDRITCGDDTYDIQSVINTDNRNRELQIMCIRVIGGSDNDIVVTSEPEEPAADYALFRNSASAQFVNTDLVEFT